MFAEKQKLVADLEAYGPGGKIVHLVDAQEAPPSTETNGDAEPATEENPPEGDSN